MTPDPIYQTVPPSPRDFHNHDRDVVRTTVLVGGGDQVIANLLRLLKHLNRLRQILLGHHADSVLRAGLAEGAEKSVHAAGAEEQRG